MSVLKKLKFDEVKDLRPKSVMVSIHGLEKTGKTRFMFGFPKPLAIYNFDQGLHRALGAEKFKVPKGVYQRVISVPEPEEADPRGVAVSKPHMDLWKSITSEMLELACSGEVRTIGIDTATTIWELCRLAHLGKLMHVKPHHYSLPNVAMENFMSDLHQSGCNVCLIHRGKYLYEDVGRWEDRVDERTGETKRKFVATLDQKGEKQSVRLDTVVSAGYSQIGFIADIECGLYRAYNKEAQRKDFLMDVKTNGFGDLETSQIITLKNSQINFPTLMAMCVDDGREWE